MPSEAQIWIIARAAGEGEARSALHYVAPVGEKDESTGP
jgi:hypothetical protein